MKVTLHFFTNDTLVRKIVCARLASKWGHVAVQIGDHVYEAGLSYGVRVTSVEDMHPPAASIDFELTEEQYDKAELAAATNIGASYDKLAMLGFFIVKRIQNDKQLFCSEYARVILEAAYGVNLKQDTLLTPGDLYHMCFGMKIGKRIN